MAATPMVFELPTGWLDPQGNLQTQVEIREMTGYEEDLIGDDRLPYNVRMNKILAGCVTKLGTLTDKDQLERIMDDLTSVDRMKVLMAIRVASLGSSLDFKAECVHCQKKSNYSVDLLTLQFVGLKNPKLREYELDLPSGKKAKCKILTGRDEAKYGNLVQRDVLSGAIFLRLISLDGKTDLTLDDVKKLGIRDRNFIRKHFDDVEGGFERNVQVECKKCGKEFETRLDVGPFEMFYQDVRSA